MLIPYNILLRYSDEILFLTFGIVSAIYILTLPLHALSPNSISPRMNQQAFRPHASAFFFQAATAPLHAIIIPRGWGWVLYNSNGSRVAI
jgi:hypothetical protein